MGYFTETMEALLEFKSDIENDIAEKRRIEHYTHSHNGNAKKQRDALAYVQKVRSGLVRNMADYEHINNQNKVKTDRSNFKTKEIYNHDGKPNRHQRKHLKESVSKEFSKAFESAIM